MEVIGLTSFFLIEVTKLVGECLRPGKHVEKQLQDDMHITVPACMPKVALFLNDFESNWKLLEALVDFMSRDVYRTGQRGRTCELAGPSEDTDGNNLWYNEDGCEALHAFVVTPGLGCEKRRDMTSRMWHADASVETLRALHLLCAQAAVSLCKGRSSWGTLFALLLGVDGFPPISASCLREYLTAPQLHIFIGKDAEIGLRPRRRYTHAVIMDT